MQHTKFEGGRGWGETAMKEGEDPPLLNLALYIVIVMMASDTYMSTP